MRKIIICIVLCPIFLVFGSCKEDELDVSGHIEDNILINQEVGKTGVELAKENEERLPYTKKQIRNSELIYMGGDTPIKNLEEFLSMYTDDELAAVENLHVNFNHIEEISGLERLSNLRNLIINHNHIKAIKSIFIPSKLSYIELSDNPLSDLSYLFNYPQLTGIGAENTNVTSIEGIGNLENLHGLGLLGAEIKDFSPLLELRNLIQLSVRFNPGCSNEDYVEIIKKVRDNNPDLEPFQYY